MSRFDSIAYRYAGRQAVIQGRTKHVALLCREPTLVQGGDAGPVRLEGAADAWPAVNWTREALLEQLGGAEAWPRDLREADPHQGARTTPLSVHDFLAGPSSELAVFEVDFCPVTRAMEGSYRVPAALRRNVFAAPVLGLAGADAGVGLHKADNPGGWASWVAQVHGSTTWVLRPPSTELPRRWPWPLPDNRGAGTLVCTLRPREALFVPAAWSRAWRGEEELNLVFGFQGPAAPAPDRDALFGAVTAGDADRLAKEIKAARAGQRWEAEEDQLVHHALLTGHLPVLKKLQLLGASFDSESPSGSTHLHSAAAAGQAQAVHFAIGHGADPSVRREADGLTPLHIAASTGHAEVIGVLMAKAKSGWKARDAAGNSALHHAAAHGHTAAAARLLDGRAQLLASQDKVGLQPLHWAAERGQPGMIDFLVAARGDLEAATRDGETVLHRAVVSGHEAVVRKLLQMGAELGARRTSGQTAVHTAAFLGHQGVLELLHGHGAELWPEGKVGQYSPEALAASAGHERVLDYLRRYPKADKPGTASSASAFAAAAAGHVSMLKKILKTGKGGGARPMVEALPSIMAEAVKRGHAAVTDFFLDMDLQVGNRGALVQAAAKAGHVALVERLAARGLDVDTKGASGDRPLLLAAASGHVAVGQRLLELRAEMEHRNEKDLSALHMAVMSGDARFARLLLERGAVASPTKKRGAHPAESGREHIHVAALAGHASLVEALADHGADVNVRDAAGGVPTFLAAEGGHVGVLQALARLRADLDYRLPAPEGGAPGETAGAGAPGRLSDGVTALSIAGAKGHVPVLKYLVRDWELPHIYRLGNQLGKRHGKEFTARLEEATNLRQRAKMEQMEKDRRTQAERQAEAAPGPGGAEPRAQQERKARRRRKAAAEL